MARVTVEDCIDKVHNRFDLILLAAQRARQISGGAELTLDRDRDKNPVVALREIADELITPVQLREALLNDLQQVHLDDDDVPDEVGSLSASAEALRLTAETPARNQTSSRRAAAAAAAAAAVENRPFSKIPFRLRKLIFGRFIHIIYFLQPMPRRRHPSYRPDHLTLVIR